MLGLWGLRKQYGSITRLACSSASIITRERGAGVDTGGRAGVTDPSILLSDFQIIVNNFSNSKDRRLLIHKMINSNINNCD